METYTVYRHTNPINNEVFYIGKGTDSRKRRNMFWHNKNDGYKRILKSITDAYLMPVVDVLNTTTEEDTAYYLEQMHINYYGRKDLNTGTLVNLTDGGKGSYGLVVSDETRKKLSELNMGENSPMYGRKHTTETLKKMSVSHLNMSDETKRKISEAHKGKKLSRETCKKISIAKLNMSVETRKKMSISKLNMSDETKRKIGEASKGRPQSMETRRKRSESIKAYYAKKKLENNG